MKKIFELLTRNLTLPFLIAGIVPMCIVAAISFALASRSLERARGVSAEALRVEATKRLEVLREEKRAAIQRYFETIRNQALTFAEDRMIVDGMRDLHDSFDEVVEQEKIGEKQLANLSRELKSYYTGEFDSEYQKQTGKSANPLAFLARLSPTAISIQHHYIRANVYPLGSKLRLDRAEGDAKYHELHARYHPVIRSYLEKFGYYDIFLADAIHGDGDIVYTVFKELDYGTSLVNGPFSDTSLARVFREVSGRAERGAVFFADYEPYPASYAAPAGFIGTCIFSADECQGALMFQLPLDQISKVMGGRDGLGETGEVYLVGADQLPRSDTYRDTEHRSVVAAHRHPKQGAIETAAVAAALAGKSGVEVQTGYLGEEVLSAYAPIEVFGQKWAMVAEISTQEAFAAVSELNAVVSQTQMQQLSWTGGMFLFACLGIIWFARRISATLKRPINEMLRSIDAAAGGDLTCAPQVNSADEIGSMAIRFSELLQSLRASLSEIKGQGEALNGSSNSLAGVAGGMASEIAQMNQQANGVVATTGQLSSNISTVAAAVEESSSNIQNVAAAVEEMSANLSNVSENVASMAGSVNGVATSIESMSLSLGNVAQRTSQAAEIVTRAASAAKLTNDKVKLLGDSAQQIGHVVGVINDIAEQTNLLALNATIEAASAGDAGRGFAVVANEVKELAKQTASATEEIRQKIQSMQENTKGSIEAIQEIVGVIDEIDEISQETAAAVSEQRRNAAQIAESVNSAANSAGVVNENVRECSKAASEVARNTEELSKGSNEIARSAGEASTAAAEMSASIRQVGDGVRHTADGAGHVDQAARDLSQLAHRLHELVMRFRV